MGERILIVDDDHHLLSALRRQLSDTFDITTAQGGKEALAAVTQAERDKDAFAVVVSDMRMPEIDGIETLRQIKTLSPDTVRIMLTGNADQQTAIEAINQGAIFRFFTKPCGADILTSGLQAALEQYRLITAERDILEKTLAGSIKLLVDILYMNDPASYMLSTRLREWVRILTVEFKLPERWHLGIAAMLLPVGRVSVPNEIQAKERAKEPLTDAEQRMIDHTPEVARNLTANIPRLSKVSEILYLQDRGFDGSGFPQNGPRGNDIPIDARLLKILKDLAIASEGGPPTRTAFARLDMKRQQYDPLLLAKVRTCLELHTEDQIAAVELNVPVSALHVGHLLLEDLRLTNGHLILSANTQLSDPQIERLRNLSQTFHFREPVRVRL